MLPIDQVQLHFNPATLAILNVILGLVMFGIALDLKTSDFRTAFKSPKGLLLATIGHHIVFPAMTYVLIWIINPIPSIALGMILVSSCPAGHLSNFLTHLSRGNTALSVSASAVSTALAIVMTPLNFNFWGNLSPVTHDLMRTISLDPLVMLKDIVILLGLPLVIGMWVSHQFPTFAARAQKPMKIFSMVVFGLFVVGALAANFQHFMKYIQFVVVVVFIHNGLALVTGFLTLHPARPERARPARRHLRDGHPELRPGPDPDLQPVRRSGWHGHHHRLVGHLAHRLRPHAGPVLEQARSAQVPALRPQAPLIQRVST
jgi:BASS family bile acid:Na+ symporter